MQLAIANVLTPLGNVGVGALAVLTAVLGINYVYSLRATKLPPGPRTGWFGSANVPKTYQWLTYAKWRELYGELDYGYYYSAVILI